MGQSARASQDVLRPEARRCACGGSCPRCQAKSTLKIGAPDDAYEREADRVAEQVMRMAGGADSISPALSGLQRKCAACEMGDEERLLQPRAESSSGAARGDVAAAPASVDSALSSPGQALDFNTRAFFEPRFGRNFSGVRVHTGGTAADGARAVQARAYTIGRDIVFGASEYAPATAQGMRLLAHELVHTLQQTGGRRSAIQRKLAVGAGLALDTQGFTTTKTGNVYTCPAIVKKSIWNELFTSLLFSPRVFAIAGTTNAEISSNLKQHMTARLGIVEFASKKAYAFAAGSAFKMNPAYWIVDATGWEVKPGVDRDKAIQDLNVHPKEYAIACLAATQLTMEGGGKSPLKHDSGVAADDWIPGDWGYITNTKFPSVGGTPGLEGENIIYTGNDKFWGHFGPGIEYKTLKVWFDQVESWNGGANTETYRDRPTIGLT